MLSVPQLDFISRVRTWLIILEDLGNQYALRERSKCIAFDFNVSTAMVQLPFIPLSDTLVCPQRRLPDLRNAQKILTLRGFLGDVKNDLIFSSELAQFVLC